MIARKLITATMQRYWRLSRGLELQVRAVVRDAGGRVLLARRKNTGPWQLPGAQVLKGETAEAALSRGLAEQTGLALEGPVRLVAIYAGRDGRTATQIALFSVSSWRFSNARPAPDKFEVAAFEPDNLPSPVEPATSPRISDVIGNRQSSELW